LRTPALGVVKPLAGRPGFRTLYSHAYPAPPALTMLDHVPNRRTIDACVVSGMGVSGTEAYHTN